MLLLERGTVYWLDPKRFIEVYFNGSQWDAGILQMLIITQAVDQIEDKIQQEMLTNASKKEDEK